MARFAAWPFTHLAGTPGARGLTFRSPSNTAPRREDARAAASRNRPSTRLAGTPTAQGLNEQERADAEGGGRAGVAWPVPRRAVRCKLVFPFPTTIIKSAPRPLELLYDHPRLRIQREKVHLGACRRSALHDDYVETRSEHDGAQLVWPLTLLERP